MSCTQHSKFYLACKKLLRRDFFDHLFKCEIFYVLDENLEGSSEKMSRIVVSGIKRLYFALLLFHNYQWMKSIYLYISQIIRYYPSNLLNSFTGLCVVIIILWKETVHDTQKLVIFRIGKHENIKNICSSSNVVKCGA